MTKWKKNDFITGSPHPPAIKCFCKRNAALAAGKKEARKHIVIEGLVVLKSVLID